MRKSYRKSDYFERLKAFDDLRQREQDVREREFRLEVNEKLLSQDQKIEAYRAELKLDIQDLKEKFSSIREYMLDQFAKITQKFDTEILQIKGSILDLKTRVKEEILDVRHQIKEEVLRLDRNAMQMVNQLERYAKQVEHYRKESEYIKREANQMRRDANFILKRANHQYEKVEWQGKKLKDQLDYYQGKMYVDFQKQKLLLDKITMDQHHALQNIAFERQGTEILQQNLLGRMQVQQA